MDINGSLAWPYLKGTLLQGNQEGVSVVEPKCVNNEAPSILVVEYVVYPMKLFKVQRTCMHIHWQLFKDNAFVPHI